MVRSASSRVSNHEARGHPSRRRGVYHRAALRADPLAAPQDEDRCRSPNEPTTGLQLQISNISSRSRGAKRPKFCTKFVPLQSEGAGNAGCALHPRSRVQRCTKKNAHEHTGSAETLRHSPRNGFTAYAALPGDEFVLSPSLADQG